MESLSLNMRLIGLRCHREAIAMRIITVVTLIYLPPTFISASGGLAFDLGILTDAQETFFGTDVVKYQGLDHGSLSYPALTRWLQISVPLTCLTLGVAFIFFKMRVEKENESEFPAYSIEAKRN